MTSDLRNNRWFGVRGSILFGSLDTGVIGRLFMMLSTSHIKVTRRSFSAIALEARHAESSEQYVYISPK